MARASQADRVETVLVHYSHPPIWTSRAEDVLTAVTYVSRREAAFGIVFDTDAKLDPGVAVVGTFPADTHPPIVYPVAAVARSTNPETPRMLAFLQSAAARTIFVAHGYTVLPAP